MLEISRDTASFGVVHESIATAGHPNAFLRTVHGPDVVLYSTLAHPTWSLSTLTLEVGPDSSFRPVRVMFVKSVASSCMKRLFSAVSAAMSRELRGDEGSLPSLQANTHTCSV